VGDFAREEIAAPAGIAIAAMAAMPADADTLAGFPGEHAIADGIDTAHDFMAGTRG